MQVLRGKRPLTLILRPLQREKEGAGAATRIPCILFLSPVCPTDAATDDEMIPICSARLFGHSLPRGRPLCATLQMLPPPPAAASVDCWFGCYMCWPAAQCPPIKLPSSHSSAHSTTATAAAKKRNRLTRPSLSSVVVQG